MTNAWRMDGNRLIYDHSGGELFWDMPFGFELPGDPVLTLAEHLLLAPYGETVAVASGSPRSGNRTAVAFSGGVDSAAVLRLVERPVPIYTQVHRPAGMHRLENALLAVEEVGGLAVVSNQDLLATFYGRKRGFYGNAGWTITSVLLAEHLDLSVFADGNILEFVYLRGPHGHGTQFVQRDFGATMEAFRTAGFEYSMPAAGLTEISTTRIAAGYKYAMGCMRGVDGMPCFNCMKCYRKSAIQGTPIKSNPEADKVLSKDWIPVLGSLLWARDHAGLAHPAIDGIVADYSWVDKWYPAAIDLIPQQSREFFSSRLKDFAIESLEDDGVLRGWSSQVR